MQGAPEGVQGVLENAGYLVYAPTLPYHAPNTQWTPNQGELRAQDYVDYLKMVSIAIPCSFLAKLQYYIFWAAMLVS